MTDTFDCRSSNGALTRLHCIDCIEGMRDIVPAASVDVMVTSPPYNLGIGYSGAYDDTSSRPDYLDWMDTWATQVVQTLKPNGSLFLNVGSKPTDPLVPFELLEVMLKHFRLQNVIHWVKSIAIMKTDVGDYPGITKDVVVGHYKPINSKRYINDCHEYIFHLTLNGNVELDRLSIGAPYQDQTNIDRWKNGGGGLHCRGNTWFLPYETINSRDKERPHPATFPVELPIKCMKLHGIEKIETAMDPFLGIGSSAVAASRLGVNFTGFELSKEYYDFACERLRDEVSRGVVDK